MNKKFGYSGEQSRTSSWQKVAPWYNKITESGRGHYYHQHVIIPNVLRLLELNNTTKGHEVTQISNIKLLDVACGNGVLAQSLPKNIEYLGIDVAPSLIKEAERNDHNSKHKFLVADATKPITQLTNQPFNCATIILALQNISDPIAVLQNISNLLIANGCLLIVLNHPTFRIPRQSAWGIDPDRKIQYRRVDKYMSPMEIPIRMNPSDPNSEQTISYHYPISDYSKMLKDAGFVIDLIEEWTSDKESEGRVGKMENRSRAEIPLFMAIVARKI